MRNERVWATEESSFVVLRALAMLGGMVAILLVPHPPEHQPYLGSLAWGFVAYKVGLFVAIRALPERLRAVLLASVCLDLVFVALFVWFGGGIESHFYLLFYLLVALVAAQFSPGIGLGTAAAAGALYAFAGLGHAHASDWHHWLARVATFFLLAGSVGYLSQRERLARARAEGLNRELLEHQRRLERAYGELQEAQARLVRSERLAAIGQMSAKVSHEVRNPLSSISLNAELLEDELAALPDNRRAEAAHLVRAIRSQVDVLSAVTEGYLQFARLPKPTLGPVSLGPLLTDLADFVREELRVRKVELVVDIDPDLPASLADAGQIMNLIRNAAEAMPDGGTVALAAQSVRDSRQLDTPATGQLGNSGLPIPHSPDTPLAELPSASAAQPPSRQAAKPASREAASWLEVTVSDAGGGIAPDDRDRIFEPFFTRKEGGTGLGLAISREIVVAHGGMLTCESGSTGGTIFRLRLPVPGQEGSGE
jgi:signal transduction histidine kinase